MDHKEEYHDPDYPEVSVLVKEEKPSESEEEKIEKVRHIIRREFSNELDIRENEVLLIDQRMTTARRLLHHLRYSLVSSYYKDQRLELSNSQIQDEIAVQTEPRARNEVSALLRDGQRRLHPSVRKLLGKKTANLDEIFKTRPPRNKTRRDYSAMLQTRNYTIPADTTKSLRPDTMPEAESLLEPTYSRPKKVPRHIEPKVEKVLTLDEVTRNKTKHRYRIIIGNTSVYAPAASRADRSTHKWLLYVHGPRAAPELAPLLTAVTVRLHHSYAPHHTVTLRTPPFHLSRRGWGEFPAKIELHFALPERNRPATVEHTIKLDRNYTGLQTLGAETVVDVWLYSTEEMLQYEYKEDTETNIQNTQANIYTNIETKQEPAEPESLETDLNRNESVMNEVINDNPSHVCDTNDSSQTADDNWLNFFTTDTTELDVDEMIIKPIKKENQDIETQIESSVISKLENSPNKDEINAVKSEPESYESNYETMNQECWPMDTNYKSKEDTVDNLPNELLKQTSSPKKRIMKYMDPTTGKIYYLEMDRNLDLSKVQEIIINSKGQVKTAKISPIKPVVNGLKNIKKIPKKGGVSLLKPEVKSLLKNENNTPKTDKHKTSFRTKSFSHIENDHCYLGSGFNTVFFPPKSDCSPANLTIDTQHRQTETIVVKKEKTLYSRLCETVKCFSCVRVAVNYMLRKIPLISEQARDPDFVRHFPFVVESEEKYWKLDFAKRRNIEWSRAKTINKILSEHLKHDEPIWRTKQILIFSRLHGYYLVRQEIQKQPEIEMEWSSWNNMDSSREMSSNIKEIYPDACDISSLSIFNSEIFGRSVSESTDLTESDEEIDIVSCDFPVKVKKEMLPGPSESLTVLPVIDNDDRQSFLFIEKKCADIGVELRNEDVGNGYSYSAVHAVILSAVKSFAEELMRGSLAVQLLEERNQTQPPSVWVGSSSSRRAIGLEHVYAAAASPRLHALSARCVGVEKKHTYTI